MNKGAGVHSCHFQPFLGSGEASNKLSGKIKLGSETLSTIDGHWDQEVYIKDKRTGVRKWTSLDACSGKLHPMPCAIFDFICRISLSVSSPTQDTQLFWNPTPEVKQKRLKRYTVPVDAQGEFESERFVWVFSRLAVSKP